MTSLLIEKPPEEFAGKYPDLLRQILWSRGFRDADEIEDFLHPSLSQLPNPVGQLKDLERAIEILLEARHNKKKIVVFGDFDVDGATSTTLLVKFFKAQDWDVGFFVPHRVKDGYGVTVEGAEKLLDQNPDAQVVVTCDCGVASFEGIDFLRSKGVQVIVTDHHEVPPKRVSADAVINPKQADCPYPDKKLAGVGVAFLLIIGLRRALNLKNFSLAPYLDLVAVGTVCDVAELVGANRSLVKAGLKQLSNTVHPGLRALLKHLKLDGKTIKTTDLGFKIGPRLNAVGRIGDPSLGIRTLLADNQADADAGVADLERHNLERRSMQEKQLKTAMQVALDCFKKNPKMDSLVISDDSFHLGIVGLLAARLADQYKKPACVLSRLDDEHDLANFDTKEVLWKGSLRTPAGYHLSDALQSIRKKHPGILVSGGGHALAAGVAVEEKNLEKFKEIFNQTIASQEKVEATVSVDAHLESLDRIEEVLEYLEPIGNANPAPLIRVKDFVIHDVRIMKEIHIKLRGYLKSKASGQYLSVLQFKSPWVKMFSGLLGKKVLLDFCGELSENEWNGRKSIEFVLKDLLEASESGGKINFRSIADEAGHQKSL
jgi:single-stranded-DNA-specific exonuclease